MSYPTTFEELRDQHAKVAVELSGAGQSAWNGVLVETDNGDLGVANWDGSLELDQESVTQPLRDMYATPGVQHDTETLEEFRDAFATLLHEQSHFLGPQGASQDEARVAFRTAGAAALEEGVTEAWAQDNLNEYMTRLGADKVAPGIENVSSEAAYPAYVPAARELASGIGAQAGMSQAEVLTALNNQTAAGQWSTAADLLYNSSNLPGLVPADQESGVKLAIEQRMRTEFERLDALDAARPVNVETQSAAIGQDAVAAAQAEIDRQEKIFAPPAAATQQAVNLTAETETQAETTAPATKTQAETQAQAETETQAGAGDEPPARTGSQQVADMSQRTASDPSAGQSVNGAETSRRDADRAMRLAMGGQRPLAKSSRLSEESFGGRRSTDSGVGQGKAQGQGRLPNGPSSGRGE